MKLYNFASPLGFVTSFTLLVIAPTACGDDDNDNAAPIAGQAGSGGGSAGSGLAGRGGGASGSTGASGSSGEAGNGGAAGNGGGGQGSALPPVQDPLVAGGFHTCVRHQGSAHCWGNNEYGQLGTSANVDTEEPTPVPTPIASESLGVVRQLALGGFYSCALRDDGRVLCWGGNYDGQLGNPNNMSTPYTPNPTPTLINNADLGVVRQLALGFSHSCALRDDGRVLCWGDNFSGQLGNFTNVGISAPTPTPTLVGNTDLGVVRQLALGRNHSCALRDDGRVLCWGSNFLGQLGNPNNMSTPYTPNPTPTLINNADLGIVRQLALGVSHSCALRDDGRVLCWGHNFDGRLGNSTNVGTNAPNPTPTLVDSADLGIVRQLALGDSHSCALRDDGRVFCWGSNEHGQLGTSADVSPPYAPNPTPTLVDSADLGVVRQLALGFSHSCALRDDGRVLCWGNNASGQLGNPTNVGISTANPTPTLVEGLPPLLP